MPKGPKGQKRPADVVSNAVHVMKVLTGEADDTANAEAKPSRKAPTSRASEGKRDPR